MCGNYSKFSPHELAVRLINYFSSSENTLKLHLEHTPSGDFFLHTAPIQSHENYFLEAIFQNSEYYLECQIVTPIRSKIIAVYRPEPRREERLLAWPRIKATLSLNMGTNEPTNIVSLKGESSFKKNLERTKFYQNKLRGERRFRVLDLSSTGLSFIISLQEQEHFDFGKKFSATLEIEGQEEIELSPVVKNCVDYIDPSISTVTFLKLGAVIERHDALDNYLQKESDAFYASQEEVNRLNLFRASKV